MALPFSQKLEGASQGLGPDMQQAPREPCVAGTRGVKLNLRRHDVPAPSPSRRFVFNTASCTLRMERE